MHKFLFILVLFFSISLFAETVEEELERQAQEMSLKAQGLDIQEELLSYKQESGELDTLEVEKQKLELQKQKLELEKQKIVLEKKQKELEESKKQTFSNSNPTQAELELEKQRLQLEREKLEFEREKLKYQNSKSETPNISNKIEEDLTPKINEDKDMYIGYAVGSGSYSYEKEYSNGDSYVSQEENSIFYESLKVGFIHDSNNYSEIIFNRYVLFDPYILGNSSDIEAGSLGYNYIIRFLKESNLSPTMTLGLEFMDFKVDEKAYDGFGMTLGFGLIYSFKHIDLTLDYKLKGHSYSKTDITTCDEDYYYYSTYCKTEMTNYYQFIDIFSFGINVKF